MCPYMEYCGGYVNGRLDSVFSSEQCDFRGIGEDLRRQLLSLEPLLLVN